MLANLSIRDIVLIDRLDLTLDDGLIVLTGETGAGKSILLDSLALALGARGDGGLVRSGQSKGEVIAAFDVPLDHPARQIAAEHEANDVDEPLLLRRVQNADGRTRAYLNDRPVSAAILKAVGTALVEIHGQHDDRALVEASAHRSLLDAFGGLSGELNATQTAWHERRAAERELRDLSERIEAAKREADYLRASVEELDELNPQLGEENELAVKRTDMMKVEKIAGDISEAVDTLNATTSPIPPIAHLARRLERKSEEVPELLAGPLEALGSALDHLEDARSGLEAALRATEFDSGELERTEERLFAIRAVARKHQCTCDDLVDLQARMRADLADLDAGEERLGHLTAAAKLANDRYQQAAAQLTEARKATAKRLEEAVHAELPALKLERARFIVQQETDPAFASAHGQDQIEFHVQTNPGTKPGPMMKVASGGELSRFLLALKVSLADRGSAPTLVFDEIDSGVGGAVSDAIGARLARLAEKVQVLTVTHAPQVAARASAHMVIAKEAIDADRVRTGVAPVGGDHRREEIARMLSGAEVTEEARAAAERLLKAG